MYNKFTIGVVIPAYNEALAIYQVVNEIRHLKYQEKQVVDSVVVCDNGSTDTTACQAKKAGAVVIREEKRGYGYACLAAVSLLKTVDILVFVDGDGSITAADILLLLQKISDGYDFVLGARESEFAEQGALFFHQKLGNKLFVRLIGWFFGTYYRDLGPLRAIKQTSYDLLKMNDKTYGWTLEMQIKAILHKLKISEIPIHYKKRCGKSKISGTFKGTFLTTIKMLSVFFGLYGKILLKKY